MQKIEIGAIYKHFKGHKYKVVGVARDSETLKEFVVYKALYGKKELWIRPVEMFLEKIKRDGKIIKRFEKVKKYEKNK